MMSQIISLITAVVFLVATIISVRGDLPWWVILLAVLAVVGTAFPTIRSKLSKMISKYKCGRREKKLVRQEWTELRKLAAALLEITESNRMKVESTIYEIARTAIPQKQDY
ncbi:MAG: hypothetical protein Q7J73_10470, partial [Dehalococcoidales bacterium]|nr:hypothetical protein [Dehalococcoidales bacterium]